MSGAGADNFLQQIERFMRRHDISATRFGVLAAGDTKFVKSLREGRQCRPATIDSIRQWMAAEERR